MDHGPVWKTLALPLRRESLLITVISNTWQGQRGVRYGWKVEADHPKEQYTTGWKKKHYVSRCRGILSDSLTINQHFQ